MGISRPRPGRGPAAPKVAPKGRGQCWPQPPCSVTAGRGCSWPHQRPSPCSWTPGGARSQGPRAGDRQMLLLRTSAAARISIATFRQSSCSLLTLLPLQKSPSWKNLCIPEILADPDGDLKAIFQY